MRGLRRSYSFFRSPTACSGTTLELSCSELCHNYVAKAVPMSFRHYGGRNHAIFSHQEALDYHYRHKTSISLEDEFWESLREIAKGRGEPISKLIAGIEEGRQFANLSSAIRLFVLRHYRNQVDKQDSTIIPIVPINGNSIQVC